MHSQPDTVPRFTVDPREGTVSGPGGTVRLEPKVMGVLLALAGRPGRVVSRDELLEEVWPGVVVTEHTLSRCIYQLRHGLVEVGAESESSGFRPIETLPKRGYRLLAAVESVGSAPSWPAAVAELPVNPFVVGQWVRGERFYGRAAQIAEILHGHRNCVWLLGTRRIGKTSLLKQVEYIAENSRDSRYLPIFWDFQGADTPAELHLNFADALLDADERLERIGIRLEEVESEDLFVSLERLRRLLRARDMKLLLLCDEVEELIELHRKDPSLLRKLRHTMQSREDIRTVLASTVRLWALADHREDTSPFLHGFAPPLYIERLTNDETRALIEQANLDPGQRPGFGDDVIEAIRQHCDNHPYLLQLVCKRYLESRAVDDAIEQVATDRMVSYFFSVDFEMLSATECDIVRAIARQGETTSDAIREELALAPDVLDGSLRRLENLGIVLGGEGRRYALPNYFFRHWLQSMQAGPAPAVEAATPVATNTETPATRAGGDNAPPVGFLAELKRRNVFRVGVAYAVVSWLILQVAEILFDFLELPNWAGKLLIAFIALGLPIALLLAWAFELTPEGLKREKDLLRSGTAPARHDRRFDRIVIVILAIAVIVFAIDKFL